LIKFRSSSKNTRNNNLKSILKRKSPQSRTKLELNIFGIGRKVAKIVVGFLKKTFFKFLFLFFSHYMLSKKSTFGFQGILEINIEKN
jgi:hypothetical protein